MSEGSTIDRNGMNSDDEQATSAPGCRLIDVYEQSPEDYDGTCLRPLGLCELGGSCDVCWYNPHRPDSIGERPKS